MSNFGARLLAIGLVGFLVPACGAGSGGTAPGGGSGAGGGGMGWTVDSSNPVLPAGAPASWDFAGVWYPSVRLDPTLPAGRVPVYTMWYEGFVALYVAMARISVIYEHAVGVATSLDGLVWQKNPTPVLSAGSVGAWDSGGVGTPNVLVTGTNSFMYYTGWSSPLAIGRATPASSGSTWTNSPAPVLTGDAGAWDALGVSSPSVLFDGSKYKMWYTGAVGSDLPGPTRSIVGGIGYAGLGIGYAGRGIGYAESADGVTWTKSTSNPVLVPGAAADFDRDAVGAASVHFDGQNYQMWYTGWKGSETAIGSATSADGLHWTKSTGNPSLVKGLPGTWNSHAVLSPCVLVDPLVQKMWFAGVNDGSVPEIGYATQP